MSTVYQHVNSLEASITAAWLLENQSKTVAWVRYVPGQTIKFKGRGKLKWKVEPVWITPELHIPVSESDPEATPAWSWSTRTFPRDLLEYVMDKYPNEYAGVLDMSFTVNPVRNNISFISGGSHDRKPHVPTAIPIFLAWLDDLIEG